MNQDYDFAKNKILEILGDRQWHRADELRYHMKVNDIPKSVFRKARQDIGVITRNNGDGTWDWRLK